MTSLYEYLRLHGDTDIYDATYDTETACAWVWAGLRPEADAADTLRQAYTPSPAMERFLREGSQ